MSVQTLGSAFPAGFFCAEARVFKKFFRAKKIDRCSPPSRRTGSVRVEQDDGRVGRRPNYTPAPSNHARAQARVSPSSAPPRTTGLTPQELAANARRNEEESRAMDQCRREAEAGTPDKGSCRSGGARRRLLPASSDRLGALHFLQDGGATACAATGWTRAETCTNAPSSPTRSLRRRASPSGGGSRRQRLRRRPARSNGA